MCQILDEVAEWVKVFDEVNVATALHRLAKLQPPGTAGPQSPVLRSAAFQLLIEASQRLVPRFEAQAVSNTLWGTHPCPLSALDHMSTCSIVSTSSEAQAVCSIVCLRPCSNLLLKDSTIALPAVF